jgi:hypothetical protein
MSSLALSPKTIVLRRAMTLSSSIARPEQDDPRSKTLAFVTVSFTDELAVKFEMVWWHPLAFTGCSNAVVKKQK